MITYEHHGEVVWVDPMLVGKHREHCLCFKCARLNTEDRNKNCPIANELFDICVKNSLVTPVYECPNWVYKESEVSE